MSEWQEVPGERLLRGLLRSQLWRVNHAATKGRLSWEVAEGIVEYVEHQVGLVRTRPFRVVKERRIKFRMLRRIRRLERSMNFDLRDQYDEYIAHLTEAIRMMAGINL